MVDYARLERDHQRRVENILASGMAPRERQATIEALVRFRDADVATAGRLERKAADNARRGIVKQTWAERSADLQCRREEADAFLENSLLAIVGIIATGFIALGVIAALVP